MFGRGIQQPATNGEVIRRDQGGGIDPAEAGQRALHQQPGSLRRSVGASPVVDRQFVFPDHVHARSEGPQFERQY